MMHLLEAIQYISLLVLLCALGMLFATAKQQAIDEANEAPAPAPYRPSKGHRKPCADVGKAVVTYRYLAQNRTMQEVANYFGTDVPRLQKLLDKHGKAARNYMAKPLPR
jgi:hypothetical protein